MDQMQMALKELDENGDEFITLEEFPGIHSVPNSTDMIWGSWWQNAALNLA